MELNISLFLLLFVSLLSFILTSISNYLAFLEVYFLQILSILIVFVLGYGHLFWHDIGLLISFVVATLIRLLFIPIVMSRFLVKGSFHLVERKMYFGTFMSMIIMLVGTLSIYALTLKIFGSLNIVFMTSLLLVFSWFLILVNHKKVIWDILGFLVLENGLFLISIALAQTLNIYIELGILIDILMSLTVFSISVIKIKQVYGTLDLKKLSQLRD